MRALKHSEGLSDTTLGGGDAPEDTQHAARGKHDGSTPLALPCARAQVDFHHRLNPPELYMPVLPVPSTGSRKNKKNKMPPADELLWVLVPFPGCFPFSTVWAATA